MDRIFVREKENLGAYNTEKIKIGVVGLGEGVGNTFIATTLAFYLLKQGKNVSFAEVTNPACRRSLIFDEVAMDKRFASRGFYDFYRGVRRGDFLKSHQNKEQGINWCLVTPEACRQGITLREEELVRLVTGISGEACIYDIDLRLFPGSGFRAGDDLLAGGGFFAETEQRAVGETLDSINLLAQMDVIIGVVEPMPAKMLGATDIHIALEKAAAKGVPLFYVVNKDNNRVVKREVLNFLKTKEIIWVPCIAGELFFYNQYNCKFHWQNKEIVMKIVDSLDKITKKIENITKYSQ